MSRLSRTALVRAAGVLALLAASTFDWPVTAALPLEVRYIANEGFLVQAGDQKILIDGLLRRDLLAKYASNATALHEAAVAGRPPFDDIDLVLITHIHYDHFNPETTVAYLKQNSAPVICPKQVAERLASDPSLRGRIQAVTPGRNQNQRVNLAGLDVDVFRLRHSPYYIVDKRTGERRDRHSRIENVGFLINLGGRTIFHVGDSGLDDPAEYPASSMPTAGVDVLFAGFLVQGELAPREAVVNRAIRPKNIVLMHLAPNGTPRLTAEQRRAFPNLFFFRKVLESRTF
jgi:L-ascorbate metabolism protein UlaG (beta-lactamase superfamily)